VQNKPGHRLIVVLGHSQPHFFIHFIDAHTSINLEGIGADNLVFLLYLFQFTDDRPDDGRSKLVETDYTYGGTVFIESFCRQIPALAREFMVIAPDSRGHGRSGDTDAPLSYRTMADDMVQLLRILNIPRAHIVGWSDGGIIGMDIALRHPEMVNRLVLIGANFDVSGLTAKNIESTKKLTPDAPEFAEVRDFYDRIAPEPKRWPVLIDKIKTMWLSQPHYSPNELRRIKSPALIIAGENDVIRESHTKEMARLIRGSRHLIVRGASHLVPIEKYETVNREIIGFLKD